MVGAESMEQVGCKRQRGARADSSLPSLPQDQKFNYTWLRLLRHGDLCIAPAGTTGALELRLCTGWESSLAWQHSSLAAARPELVSGLGGGGPITHMCKGTSPPWGPEPGGPLMSPELSPRGEGSLFGPLPARPFTAWL